MMTRDAESRVYYIDSACESDSSGELMTALMMRNKSYYLQPHDQRLTVNPEIFARILFSRIALKDIFAKLKIRD